MEPLRYDLGRVNSDGLPGHPIAFLVDEAHNDALEEVQEFARAAKGNKVLEVHPMGEAKEV